MINDVSRAFFCAPAKRQVFVELPTGDRDSDDDLVGELNFRCMVHVMQPRAGEKNALLQ